MRDLHFGSLNRRELTLRLFPAQAVREWTDRGPVFSWRRLLKPRTWLRLLFREEWSFDFWGNRQSNHRCYCPGTLFDGRLVVAGFGLIWFFSEFRGEVPCPCDVAMAEVFPEDADDE